MYHFIIYMYDSNCHFPSCSFILINYQHIHYVLKEWIHDTCFLYVQVEKWSLKFLLCRDRVLRYWKPFPGIHYVPLPLSVVLLISVDDGIFVVLHFGQPNLHCDYGGQTQSGPIISHSSGVWNLAYAASVHIGHPFLELENVKDKQTKQLGTIQKHAQPQQQQDPKLKINIRCFAKLGSSSRESC